MRRSLEWKIGVNQAPKDGFQIGQHRVGFPEGSLIPMGFVGAQAIDPRMGEHRAGERFFLPREGGGLLTGGVCRHCDLIMSADPAAFAFKRPIRSCNLSMHLLVRGFVNAAASFASPVSKR